MLQLFYIFLYGLYACLFGLLIFRWRFFEIDGVNKRHLALFFLLKITAGLALTFIYTYYYTDQSKADIYRYFNDSKIISSVIFVDPLAWLKIITGIGSFEPGTFSYLHNTWHFTHPSTDLVTTNSLLIKVISFLNYFSGYNIYIDTLLLNCITFMAITVLFKALKPYFPSVPQILYWPLYLMPSFLFWSSGLLKEGLMFVGIAGYVWVWLAASELKWWQKAVVAVLSLAIIGSTKIYVALVILLCTGFLPFNNVVSAKYIKGVRLAFYIVAFGALGYGFASLPLCEKIIEKRNEFVMLSLTEQSASAVDNTFTEPDCPHLWASFPQAFVNAVLRPFVWSRGNMFQSLFALENMLFIAAMAGLLIFFFKRPQGQKLWLALFCFAFAALNYIAIGLTVPVVGAIVHYRIVAMPFLLLSVLLMTDVEKLNTFFTTKARRH